MARANRKPNPTARLDQHLRASELRFSTLLGVLQTLMTIGFAWGAASLIGIALAGQFIDVPDGSQELLERPLGLTMNASIGLILSTLLVKALASYAQNLVNLRSSVYARDRLRQHILDNCFRLGINLFPAFKPSELANLLTLETDKLKDYFADYQIQKKMALYTPVLILAAAATVNWLVPLLLLLTTPLIPLFMVLIGKRAAQASRANLEALNRLGHLLEDRLANLNLLQEQDSLSYESKSIYESSDRFRKSTMKVLRLAFLSGTLLEFFAAISVALVAVYLGLFFLEKYSFGSWEVDISFAKGAFLLMLAPEYYLPLRKLGALYHAKSNARALAERLEHLDQLAQALNAEAENSPLPALQTLECVDLCSGSPNPVHQPFSCTLQQGDSLLLEAPSGTGKTTLLDTLAGLRAAHSGFIRVNGVEIKLHDNSAWQAQIGYISQQAELIYGTLRDNLTLGRAFSDETLLQALEQAQLRSLVEALPTGLNHFITDAGDFLSGGQIQRLAIARALLHKPRLLLLDEPIANLDQDTAQRFMQALAFHTESGGILIMASHRSAAAFPFTQRQVLNRAQGATHA